MTAWRTALVRCDGVTRRDLLRIGCLSAFGLSLSDLFALRGNAAVPRSKADHCILIWLDGGPSHLETFDLKPDAPEEVRGPFQPIATAVPGIQVCELLPLSAQRMNQITLIRSMTSPLGEHNLGTHYMMTGYKPTAALEYPQFGCVVSHLASGQTAGALPGHIAVPDFRVGGGKFTGNGYLPAAAAPFSIEGDPAKPDFRVRDLDRFPGISVHRFERRREFLQTLDDFTRLQEAAQAPATSSEYERAFHIVTSPEAKQAFELSAETPAVRQRYGIRSIGQCCLLARRLVERGVPFVTVNNRGWDTHADQFTRLKEGYTGAKVPVGLIPSLDQAVAALVGDLDERGLLERTLVVVMGEFGRTPKLNTQGGRDHWPRVFSVLLAGGGVPGGQVVGSSDSVGESPADTPVRPEDLVATIYTLLGVDPHQELQTADGRPVRLTEGVAVPQIVG